MSLYPRASQLIAISGAVSHSECQPPKPRSCSWDMAASSVDTRPGTRTAADSATAQPTGFRLRGMVDEPPRPGAERVFRRSLLPIEGGDQSAARAFVGGAVENRIERQQRIAGKIHLGDKPRHEGWAEPGEMNMRWPPGVVMIAPGVSTGLDGNEPIATFCVAKRTAKPVKLGSHGASCSSRLWR